MTAMEEIQKLEERIAELRQKALDELRVEIAEARKVLSDLEAQYESMSGKTAKATTPRVRLKDIEIQTGILSLLANDGEEGMSGNAIAKALGIGYPRITRYFKENPKEFKKTGAGKQTRYFLK
jgi:uncharacterized coiled-coil protein SlyX